eukprot:g10669.t1
MLSILSSRVLLGARNFSSESSCTGKETCRGGSTGREHQSCDQTHPPLHRLRAIKAALEFRAQSDVVAAFAIFKEQLHQRPCVPVRWPSKRISLLSFIRPHMFE